MYKDINVFKDTKLSDLLLLSYRLQKSKSIQILLLILQLRDMVTTVDLAILLVPSIANYLTLGLKNDLVLLKIVTNTIKAFEATVKLKLSSTLPNNKLITDALFELLLSITEQLVKDTLEYQKLILKLILGL